MKMYKKKSGSKKIWPVPLLAFGGTLCLPYILNLKGETLVISNSWFGVFIWVVLCLSTEKALERKKARDRREKAAAYVLGFLFSLCLAFGASLEQAENVDFGNGMMWLSVAVWGFIFGLWIGKGWEILGERADQKKEAEGHGKGEKCQSNRFLRLNGWKRKGKGWIEKWDGLSGKKRAGLLFCFFLLCWLPVFLAVYPGFFVYDAQDELIQVQTRNFTTHHPLPHVLLLGGVILGVHKLTGSYNAGIGVYTFLQMCLLAAVFTYVIAYMGKCRVRRGFRVMTAFYFGFFPVIVMFALCSAKDGIFTAAMLLLLTALDEMAKEKENYFTGWKKPLFFACSAVVMMCFRHNGMYAFLVLSLPVLFYMKGCRKKTGALLGMIFALYFLISAGLAGILNAEDPGNQEMLTVPIQQLARVYRYDRESLSREDEETLYEILPQEALRFYAPKVSDGVKIWFQNSAFAADPVKYGRLWMKIGMKHPFTYLNAWFMTSYGFWYPDTVIDVYRGNSVFTFTYEDSSYFGYEVEQPGTRESKLPWLNEWYRKLSLEITQQKVPLLSMLFSPGFLFWIFAFTAGYAFYRKEESLFLPFAMILLVWLTVILGPTYLPRYVLVLWFALPGVLAVYEHGL